MIVVFREHDEEGFNISPAPPQRRKIITLQWYIMSAMASQITSPTIVAQPLAKIKSYGIEGKFLKWIKEFLENMQQRILVNGNYSDWNKVTIKRYSSRISPWATSVRLIYQWFIRLRQNDSLITDSISNQIQWKLILILISQSFVKFNWQ